MSRNISKGNVKILTEAKVIFRLIDYAYADVDLGTRDFQRASDDLYRESPAGRFSGTYTAETFRTLTGYADRGYLFPVARAHAAILPYKLYD